VIGGVELCSALIAGLNLKLSGTTALERLVKAERTASEIFAILAEAAILALQRDQRPWSPNRAGARELLSKHQRRRSFASAITGNKLGIQTRQSGGLQCTKSWAMVGSCKLVRVALVLR